MKMTSQDFLMWLSGLLEGMKVEHGISAVLAAAIKRNLAAALALPPPPPPTPRELLDMFEKKKEQRAPTPQYELFPTPTIGSCAVCGMKFEGAMGYVCSNPLCPSAVRCTA